MEFKDGAFVAFTFSLVLAFLAYFTGGLLFYVAFFLSIVFIVGDFLWLKAGAGSLRRRLPISTSLSRSVLSPGSRASLTLAAAYTGWPGLALSAETLIDDSIESKPPDKKMGLRAGEEMTLILDVVPTKCGSFDVGHAKVVVSSLLFRDTFLAGNDLPLKVRLSIGKSRLRPNVVFPSYYKYSRIYDSVVERRGGSDFSGVKEYTAGENTKHIDWALSARAGELMVREYEAERALPVYVLIDVSRPPLSRKGADFSVDVAMEFINRQLVDGDKLGLICFSRTGVVYHVRPGMGREHMRTLAEALSKLQAGGDEDVSACGPLVSVKELYDIGHVFEKDPGMKTLTPFIEESLKGFMLNARSEGFVQAILTMTRASKGPCQVKVVTGLSMGLPAFLNGVRLARYYGHTVTAILDWEADERPIELKAAMSKLRAQSVQVISPGTPGGVFSKGRIDSRRGIRR